MNKASLRVKKELEILKKILLEVFVSSLRILTNDKSCHVSYEFGG